MDYCLMCAYNEEKTLTPIVEEMSKHFPLILIDNGSTDNTYKIMKKLSGSNIISMQEPKIGKANAQRLGFNYALSVNANNILTMDLDGEHKPQDMLFLYNKHINSNCELTAGSRFDEQDKPLKDQIVACAIKKITGNLPIDPRCGTKIYSNQVLTELLPQTLAQNYGLDVELLLLSQIAGFTIKTHKISYSKLRERVLLTANYSSAELTDLYNVFGRGNLIKGEKILSHKEELEKEFLDGNSHFFS